ncbi:hypothetical protein F2Q69_00046648 [Brassica cretica]|uniref:Uncharacterized protein n=1 Tax=Brassica cretica TaxID=69181 RepID=A0A8S9PNH0_BRACR|nr:hypothetical protein F2Q69_00046648 [Brassica cretica]
MFFRRWDPGSQGLKRNQSDLYHDDKIGRICRRKGILVLRRILWVGEKIGIEGSVSSLRSSKWMWNPEDQSQDYQVSSLGPSKWMLNPEDQSQDYQDFVGKLEIGVSTGVH